ncbi:hypothetical protein ACLOJK_030841 [Asimina triloba]
MGCSSSKMDDEDPVQLCKNRRRFIKQAVEYRIRFAAGHAAYIQSLRRVSAALRTYVEGDEHREFFSDPYMNPPFKLSKKTTPEFITIPLKSLPSNPVQSRPSSSRVVNYLRSGGNPAVTIEERPQSPETVRIGSYSSPIPNYGADGLFAMQSSPMNSSSYFYSPHNRPVIPPPSPQTSQWDFFWNPFSSLETYGYPTRNSFDQMYGYPSRSSYDQMYGFPTGSSYDQTVDDEMTGLRQVREEEGIPDLEEEDEEEFQAEGKREEQAKVESSCSCDSDFPEEGLETDVESDSEHEMKGFKSQAPESAKVSEATNRVELEVTNREERTVADQTRVEETPGFIAYANRRPTSMAEVVTELEKQFMIVCDSAKEVSMMMEASKAQYAMTGNELTEPACNTIHQNVKSGGIVSHCILPIILSVNIFKVHARIIQLKRHGRVRKQQRRSHPSTLDRLYAWEKKLYEEVKAGERIRIAYDKKCKQLRGHDVKGADASSVDKTRAALRDLDTRMKVSMHAVIAVSRRIETLRDEELQPQLMELIQGLAKMWKVMAECHHSQKRTIDAAKLLLAGTPPKAHPDTCGDPEPGRLARAAASLESELRNWRACFESWIASLRSYIRALTGWARCCARPEPEPCPEPENSPPRRSAPSPPIFRICIQWSRFLDAVREDPVIDGLDFFAAGVGSVYGREAEEEAKRSKRFGVGFSADSEGKMAIVEVGRDGGVTAVKTADLAVRVLCAGMGVAVSSLKEFAVGLAEGYEELVKQWEKEIWAQVRVGV